MSQKKADTLAELLNGFAQAIDRFFASSPRLKRRKRNWQKASKRRGK